jgi:hypothetical protein
MLLLALPTAPTRLASALRFLAFCQGELQRGVMERKGYWRLPEDLDSPDMADINPQEHPRRSRSAVVASSRIVLDISYLRGQFEGVANEAEYRKILTDQILPQKMKV